MTDRGRDNAMKVPLSARQPGPGLDILFWCGGCQRKRRVLGRRLRRIAGFRLYDCAECVAKGSAA